MSSAFRFAAFRVPRSAFPRSRVALNLHVQPVMKITLTSDDSLRLDPDPGPMTIEALSEEQQYSPFHMLASGLAFCTFSVLYAWATHANLVGDDIVIDVRWTFADDPHRVGSIALDFIWPSLPAQRLDAAKRVAELCTIHATLTHPPAITIDGRTTSRAEPAAPSPSEPLRKSA